MALALRLGFQAEAVPLRVPFQADAGKYFSIAFNWKNHGAYSHHRFWLPPEGQLEPSGIRPGYPLFLLPFAPTLEELAELTRRGAGLEFLHALARPVRRTQAWLGALSAVLAYLLALQCLRPGWALAAGLLAATSPHLMAAEFHVLTETLFVFVLLAALLGFCAALRSESRGLCLASGMLFGAVGLVRAIGWLLGPWLALLFLLETQPASRALARKLLPFVLGYALVTLGWQGVHSGLRGDAPVGTTHTSFSKEVLAGADVDFAAKRRALGEAAEGRRPEPPPDADAVLRDLGERPGAFLRWYLWGKLAWMWRWDNFHTGTPHIYPLARSPFESAPLYAALHAAARATHGPLLGLAACAPLAWWWTRRRGGRAPRAVGLVPAMALLYFVGVLWVLTPMPRYSIPARPLLFIVALGSLAAWVQALGGRRRPTATPRR